MVERWGAKANELLHLHKYFFKISLRFALLGLLGAMVPFLLLWTPRRFLPEEAEWRVSVRENEPILLMGDDPSGRSMVDFLRNLFFQHLPWDICFFPFFPALFSLYVRLEGWKLCLVGLPSLVGYIVFVILRWHVGLNNFLVQLSLALPLALFGIGLFLVLPRDSQVPRQVFFNFMVLVSGVGLLRYLNSFDALNSRKQILSAVIVFPGFREITYFLARFSARHLATSERIAGVGVQVRREICWGFFMWVQGTTALLLRLFFTRINDPVTMAIVVAYQSLVEIFMRVTLQSRDKLFSRAMHSLKLCFHPQMTQVVPSHTVSTKVGNSQDSCTLEQDLITDESVFVSMLIIGDMLMEFSSIFTAPLLVALYSEAKLQIPLDYYREMEHPFDESFHPFSLVLWTCSQLVSELCVDTFCSVWEYRRGLDVESVWKRQNVRTFLVVFFFACCIANANIFALVKLRDSIGEKCLGKDMCWCANGNGLNIGGLRDSYCKRIYPSPGFPPNTTRLLP